jgi:predicted acyl esterase
MTTVREAFGGQKMALDKDVAIKLSDGAILRADVYRPEPPGKYPALMTYGPYGKDSHISQFMGQGWERLKARHPEIVANSTGKHMVFERPDPEAWVPHGYVIIHVDCRGAGRSPGKLDVNSPQEFKDFAEAIEWAGEQAWCNGKVGLLGISYYAAGQWMAASYKPKHLAAILPWAGTCDFYRDRTRHGGIFVSGFVGRWWQNSVLNNQHGKADSTLTDFVNNERSTGPDSLSAEELKANRFDYIDNVRAHPLLDDWYKPRSADLAKIDVPALVVSNWGGLGLHLRGTIQGFLGIASKDKWLKVQTGPYFATFFAPDSVALQRRFFDRYLKGIENGWEKEPRVDVTVRSPDDKVHRHAYSTAWPLEGSHFVKLHLDAANRSLGWKAPSAAASASYAALSEGTTFTSEPLDRDMEIAGPLLAKLQLSCSKPDMDIFCTVLAFDPSGREINFATNFDPIPVSQGWLRVALRNLDRKRSSSWQPVHVFDKPQPLDRGEIVEAQVEVWPTAVFLPKGSRLAVILSGQDYTGTGRSGSSTSGNFLHNDPVDRPQEKYNGEHTVHSGGGRECWLQFPVIQQ